MTTTADREGANSRRRFLALAGAAAATAVAGCTGSADEADPNGESGDGRGDGGDGSGGAAGERCDGIRGPLTAFDPGDRQFPFLFEYPETFEEYNRGSNESDGAIGAQLGHVASAEANSYPVNLVIFQHTRASTDQEASHNWVTSFGASEQLDWSFTYDGEERPVYENTAFEDPESSKWNVLLPAAEGEGTHGVTVQFQDIRSDLTCMDALTTVAQSVIESLEPNPDWTGPS